MTELDQTTGLPTLPEGHWWEVRKYETTECGGWGFSSTLDGYQVCVVTKATIPASSKPGKRWWNSDIVTPARSVDKVVHRSQITDPALYAKRGSATIGDYYSAPKVGKREIAPADILKAALDLMDYMEGVKAAKVRRAESDSLLGVYPPKALAS